MRALPAVLLCLSPIARADDIDDYIQSEMKRLQIPAVTYAVVKNGEMVRSGAVGFSDIATKKEAKVDDLFEIGSLTKQFTAMGVLTLIEAGRIDIEESISKYLPDLPAKWAPIKVRNLLYQNSGLPEYTRVPGMGLTDKYTRAQFLEKMGSLPVDFGPGVAWAYSNTNYALLGWMIEDVSKEPYTKFIEENILRPVGMTHTSFIDPSADLPTKAKGYLGRWRGDMMLSPKGSGSIKSDCSMISNIPDMVKWDQALTDLRILKRKSYLMMWTRGALNSGRVRPYGMGWFLNLPGTGGYMGHGGNSAGFSAGFSRFPGRKVSVILLSNLYMVSGETMTKHIAELFDATLQRAAFAEVEDPDPKRTERVKLAIAALAENKADETLLEPEACAPLAAHRARQSGIINWWQVRTIDKIAFGGARPKAQTRY